MVARLCWLLALTGAGALHLTTGVQHCSRPTIFRTTNQPICSLGALSWLAGGGVLGRAAVALPVSTAALVALNVAQNGPDRPTNLESVMRRDDVSVVHNGRPLPVTSDGGWLVSSAFTPTDSSPECLADVLTLRTKADVVRAWQNGVAPALPGQHGPELYDGALLRRGALAPLTGLITHRLFGPFRRWRGKTFESGGCGTNRFGGARPNYFGLTGRGARELERLTHEQIRARKALSDPLMLQLMAEERQESVEAVLASSEGAEAEREARCAALRVPEDDTDASDEVRGCPFEMRIDASRLDGKSALILDYGTAQGDRLWGGVLGMRDELREVVPGVLVGLGSMGATGGVRNCAPFVLVQAATSADE